MEQTNPAPASDTGEQDQTNNPVPEPSASDDDKKGSVPYARFAEVVNQRKAAEEALTAVVEGMVAELPEAYQDLVPAALSPVDKCSWIQAAKAKGLFNKQSAPAPPELDTKRPGGKAPADLSKLNPHQLLRAGYK